jgi:hypothetical protein
MGTSPSGRFSLNGELFRQVCSARLFVGASVALGILSAVATIAQVIFLSQIVDCVYLKGASLADVRGPLILLLGAVFARAALLWAREVVAGRGAVRVKSALRELAWRTLRYGATPATFGAVIGTASDLPTLAGAAAGGLPVLGATGVKALLDRRDKLKQIRDNQLYFYYRAGERLGAGLG